MTSGFRVKELRLRPSTMTLSAILHIKEVLVTLTAHSLHLTTGDGANSEVAGFDCDGSVYVSLLAGVKMRKM